jgi:hypothetical protein
VEVSAPLLTPITLSPVTATSFRSPPPHEAAPGGGWKSHRGSTGNPTGEPEQLCAVAIDMLQHGDDRDPYAAAEQCGVGALRLGTVGWSGGGSSPRRRSSLADHAHRLRLIITAILTSPRLEMNVISS